MTAGGIISILIILFGGFFIVYKRKMLMEVFSLNMHTATMEFQTQLEAAGAVVIRQLEEKMNHLEFLLTEAENRSRELEDKLTTAERLLKEYENKAVAHPSPVPFKAQPVTEDWYAAQESVVAQSGEVETEKRVLPEVQDIGDRRKLILTMAEQGYSVTEIAKATGAGKGEIMLLLQLHRK
jgi:hypothetical protein